MCSDSRAPSPASRAPWSIMRQSPAAESGLQDARRAMVAISRACSSSASGLRPMVSLKSALTLKNRLNSGS